MFNEAIDEFDSSLEIGKKYYISNGNVKTINSNYKNVHDKYEIILNVGSRVTEIQDDKEFIIDNSNTKFLSIEQLQSEKKTTLSDVLVLVLEVGELTEVQRKKDNKNIVKRDITVQGIRSNAIVLTLWESLAKKEGKLLELISDKKPVVSITSVAVSTFQGFCLSTTSSSTIEINPKIPEADEVRDWSNSEEYQEYRGTIQTEIKKNIPMDVDEVTIDEILTRKHDNPDEPMLYYCRAWISDVIFYNDPWYNACNVHKKKVILYKEGAECQKCQSKDVKYSPRYLFKIKIIDATAEAVLTLFDTEATLIIRHDVNDMVKLQEEGKVDEFNRCMRKCIGDEWTFLIKVQDTTYRERTSRTLIAYKIKNKDDQEDEENQKHLKRIKVEKD